MHLRQLLVVEQAWEFSNSMNVGYWYRPRSCIMVSEARDESTETHHVVCLLKERGSGGGQILSASQHEALYIEYFMSSCRK